MFVPYLKVDGSALETYDMVRRSVAGAAWVTEGMVIAGSLLQDNWEGSIL